MNIVEGPLFQKIRPILRRGKKEVHFFEIARVPCPVKAGRDFASGLALIQWSITEAGFRTFTIKNKK
jgi:hypothetical protein